MTLQAQSHDGHHESSEKVKSGPTLPYHSEISEFAFKLSKTEQKLSSVEIALLHAIRAGANNNTGVNFRSHKRFAQETGYSREAICRASKKLRKRELIHITSAKNGKSNETGFTHFWQIWRDRKNKKKQTPCDRNAQGGVTHDHRGCDPGSQGVCATITGGVTHDLRGCDPGSFRYNSINREKEYKNFDSSSLIAEQDEDLNLKFSKKSAEEDKQNNESEKISDFDKRKSEADKWFSKLSPDEIEKLTDFLEMKVAWHKPGDPSAYKLAIIENIIAGKQPDFERHEGPRFKFRLLDGAKWDDE